MQGGKPQDHKKVKVGQKPGDLSPDSPVRKINKGLKDLRSTKQKSQERERVKKEIDLEEQDFLQNFSKLNKDPKGML